MAVPGRDLHLCKATSVGGTGWAARRSSDLGEKSATVQSLFGKAGWEHPLQWPAWLSRSSARQEGSILLLKSNGREKRKREQSQGKRRKQNCAHTMEQEDSYSNTNTLGMSKIPWAT